MVSKSRESAYQSAAFSIAPGPSVSNRIDPATKSIRQPRYVDRISGSYSTCSRTTRNKVLYLRYRSSGKEVGNQGPVVLRSQGIRLGKEGFICVEGTIKIIVLVPFVLRMLYL